MTPATGSTRQTAHQPGRSLIPTVEASAGDGAWGHPDAGLARAGFDLRRLRYFRDLLADGFRAAGSTEPSSRTLRSERIDLGIDFPELDAVALWAARNGDGAVSIPFLEFILGQFISALETFLENLGNEGARTEVLDLTSALHLALKEANRGGSIAIVLPRLDDNFLSALFLARVCGSGGLLDRMLDRCEALLSGSAFGWAAGGPCRG